MTTIRNTIDLDVPADEVWDVVRDVGAVHTRFAPGFVIDTKLEPGARLVTFANELTLREVIIDVNEDLRRLAYSARNERVEHHCASFEVIALSASQTRLVWTADVLPAATAEMTRRMMSEGSDAIRRAFAKGR